MRFVLVSLFAALLASELMLRIAWRNPYRGLQHPSDSAALYPEKIDVSADVTGLYPGAGRVRLRTTAERAIFSGKPSPAVCWALGGSTTASLAVPEGKRWPDLVTAPTLNFGVSGNSTLESLDNFRHLLRALPRKPKCALVMNSNADVTRFILHDDFSERTPREPVHISGISSEANLKIANHRIWHSDLISFFVFHYFELTGRNPVPVYDAVTAYHRHLPVISDAEFAEYYSKVENELIPRRRLVLEALREEAERWGVTLVLLSQPHAFFGAADPLTTDYRLTPRIRGKQLTFDEARHLLELVNSSTMHFAEESHVASIDVAGCFNHYERHNAFLDSVHYTPEGSRIFSDCVNRELPWILGTRL